MFGSVLGIESQFVCGVLALGIFSGAYIGEILRAGIQNIHHGQMEAARSLGMNVFQSYRYVILPQVFKQTLPSMSGTFISLIKDSSLVSVMALTDLTKAGREIVSSSFMVFETWITVAILYFVLTAIFSFLFRLLEQRLSLGSHKKKS
jgi:polar amino acid transport system permease protein